MYTDWDISVREIGGGAWFFMSFFLVLSLIGYLYRRRTWDFASVLAISLVFFVGGSAMRAFLSWMQFLYANKGWDEQIWIRTWPWFGMSVMLNIFGAAMAIWLVSKLRNSWALAILSVVFAVVVPVAIHFNAPD